MARLTWEYCAAAWGLASSSNFASSLTHASLLTLGATRALTPREDAQLALRSARGAVPEEFARGYVAIPGITHAEHS